MAQNKYDFIKELLEDKRIQQNQRERILELASREISLEGTLEKRVQKIEKMLFDNTPFSNETASKKKCDNTKQSSDYEKIPKYYNSHDLYDFLKDFHQNYFLLKPTSHPIDTDDYDGICEFCEIEEYNHEIILSKIKIDYQNLEHKYNKKFVSKNMTALIWTYLFGGQGKKWDNNISVNWSSPELIDWCKENTGLPPNPASDICNKKLTQGFVFQDTVKPKYKLIKEDGVIKNDINNFGELCIHFKHLFHLRADNQLEDIIKNNIINQSLYSKWEIDLEEIYPLECYTDVSKLIQLTERVFNLINVVINEHADLDKTPNVKLSFKDLGSFIEFKIYHVNTVFKRPKNALMRPGKNLKRIIERQVNGIGDFDLIVEIDTGEVYEIKLWSLEIWKNGGNFLVEQKIDSPHKGVAYILKMKK